MQINTKLFTDKTQQFQFFQKKYIISKYHIFKLISFYLFYINYIYNYIKIYSFILEKRKIIFNSNLYFLVIFKNDKFLNIPYKQNNLFFNKQKIIFNFNNENYYFIAYNQKKHVKNNLNNKIKQYIKKKITINFLKKKNIIIKIQKNYYNYKKIYFFIKYNIKYINLIYLKKKKIYQSFNFYDIQNNYKYSNNIKKYKITNLSKFFENMIYINYLMLNIKEQFYIQQLYIQHDVIGYFFTIKLNNIIVNGIDLFSKKILFNTTSKQFGFIKFKYNIRHIFEILFKVCFEYSLLHKYQHVYLYIRLCPFLKKRIFFLKMLNLLFKENNKKKKKINMFFIEKYFHKYDFNAFNYKKKYLYRIKYYKYFKYFQFINTIINNKSMRIRNLIINNINFNKNIYERTLFIDNLFFLNIIKKIDFHKIVVFQIEYIRIFGGCRLKKIRRKRRHSRHFFHQKYQFNFFWKFNKI